MLIAVHLNTRIMTRSSVMLLHKWDYEFKITTANNEFYFNADIDSIKGITTSFFFFMCAVILFF